jgi:hypothetical protein
MALRIESAEKRSIISRAKATVHLMRKVPTCPMPGLQEGVPHGNRDVGQYFDEPRDDCLPVLWAEIPTLRHAVPESTLPPLAAWLLFELQLSQYFRIDFS